MELRIPGSFSLSFSTVDTSMAAAPDYRYRSLRLWLLSMHPSLKNPFPSIQHRSKPGNPFPRQEVAHLLHSAHGYILTKQVPFAKGFA